VSAAIRERRAFDTLVFPTGLRLTEHPQYRVGRFPTEPVPPEVVARWPRAQNWHVELRDLARWRELRSRWELARAA
jgi:hypothetical protein